MTRTTTRSSSDLAEERSPVTGLSVTRSEFRNVLGEFWVTATGKQSTAATPSDASLLVERMQRLPVVPIDTALVTEGIAGSGSWGIPYWDALIIAAARSSSCRLASHPTLSAPARGDAVLMPLG
jgi:predicted nucleic acid-binding protein